MKPTCKFCLAHHDADEGHPAEAVREALAELRRTEPKVSAIEVGRHTFEDVRERVAKPVTSPVTVHPEPVEAPVTVHLEPERTVTEPERTVTRNRAWEAKNQDRVREANRDRQQRRRAAHSGAVDGMPGSTS